MTISRFGRLAAFALPLLLSACVTPSAKAPLPAATAPVKVAVPVVVPPGATPQPPAMLATRIAELGRGFAGRVGISVRDIQAGWIVSFNGTARFPQQSVSKLWVAITLLDRIDRGTVRLDQPVTIRREDLTLFHQPIAALVGASGYTTTVRDLFTRAMTQSDNTANDALLRLVGGPDSVRAMMLAKGIGGIRFGPGERLLQAQTAGLTWKQSMGGLGRGFEAARAALPLAQRQAALDRYLADPIDGAEPDGITAALAKLRKTELLSPASTQLLLSTMAQSKTGPKRLKGGIDEDWAFAHKTGTGQDLGGTGTGYNDVAILTAPDGRTYSVAVMIASTRLAVWQRMQMMQNVTRAVIGAHGVAVKP
ncbi:serine hydrolase [Sphingomonas naphthae]|uniref:beta-lactamase n=1 Tax=Sphingomonas naphthae TaxID=1813468 RepID=A0ABY7TN07_9SPHN|nr:serine hydrolase [Sphingomonas naphthae]WCT74628.1 serine hydrolase [Sphingomonas naphthae]